MPRHIENYAKQEAAENANRFRPSAITMIILTIILAFLWIAGADASELSRADQTTLLNKSQLCMVQYTQNNCDALNLSPECTRLLSCVQLKDVDAVSSIKSYADALSKEITADYHFPAFLIMSLLLIKLILVLREERIPRQ